MDLKQEKYNKYHITNPNLVSKIYFSFIYHLISEIIDYENKKILDFGEGQGFLKKKINFKIFLWSKIIWYCWRTFWVKRLEKI